VRLARFAARLHYDYLIRDGVKIYEYERRQLHAKVAVIDDDWVSVGSSNLEPLSLWFNLEANVVIRHQQFNHAVAERLHALMEDSCRPVSREHASGAVFWRVGLGFVAYHFLRRFPRLSGLLPAHRPRLTRVPAPNRRWWKDRAT
jgi:cardiolipin synthase